LDFNFPVQRKSQLKIFDQADVGRSSPTLKRMQVALPDLSNSIDPMSSDANKIISGLLAFERDRGGLSVNSVYMLASVLRTWDKYCQNRQAYAFPVTLDFALGWLRYERFTNKKSIETLRQYRAQLTYLLKWMEVEHPFDSKEVKAFMSSLKKDQTELTQRSYRQRQAFGMRGKDLLAIIYSLDVSKPLNLRNLALACCCYSTMLRESELCRLKRSDIKILENNTVLIERTHSKTSSTVASKLMIGLFAGIMRLYLSQISKQIGINGYVFSRMSRTGKLLDTSVPMSGQTMDRCLTSLFDFAKSNGIEFQSPNPKTWTGHSGRVGGVQDAFLSGMSDAKLMQLGDWSTSQMVQRYVRELDYANSANALNQTNLFADIDASDAID
jgi:integrase